MRDNIYWSVVFCQVDAMVSSQICSLMDLLICQADIYDLTISSDEALLMVRHLFMVIDKNKYVNLTRITNFHDAIVRHYIDSLLFVKAIKDSHNQFLQQVDSFRFLDLGTGAGFPGIPFSIVTGMSGLLIDSVTKKIRAVQEFIVGLGLTSRICTLSIRAEELALHSGVSFDFVLARAVADLSVLVEYASPLLRNNGLLVSSKARIQDGEVVHAKKVAHLCGMRLVSRETYDLPSRSGYRELICFMKVNNAIVDLPRKPGMAKHRPL